MFVEQAGACDVPSACKHAPKHEDVGGPLPYEQIVSTGSGSNSTSTFDDQLLPNYVYVLVDFLGCEVEGYFSHFCTVEFFNCVHGKTFVGKCPAGLVFNPHKTACDYVESCISRGEDDSRPSVALPVPSTEMNKGCV